MLEKEVVVTKRVDSPKRNLALLELNVDASCTSKLPFDYMDLFEYRLADGRSDGHDAIMCNTFSLYKLKRYLAEGNLPTEYADTDYNLLQWACYKEKAAAAKFLITNEKYSHVLSEINPDTNTKKWNDRVKGSSITALHLACANGMSQTVGLLLEKGADPAVELQRGYTPIMLAAKLKNFHCVEEILKAYPEYVNVADEHGISLLMHLCGFGMHKFAVKFINTYNVDLSA